MRRLAGSTCGGGFSSQQVQAVQQVRSTQQIQPQQAQVQAIFKTVGLFLRMLIILILIQSMCRGRACPCPLLTTARVAPTMGYSGDTDPTTKKEPTGSTAPLLNGLRRGCCRLALGSKQHQAKPEAKFLASSDNNSFGSRLGEAFVCTLVLSMMSDSDCALVRKNGAHYRGRHLTCQIAEKHSAKQRLDTGKEGV